GLLVLHSDAALIDGDGAPKPGSLFEALQIERRELNQMHQAAGFQTLIRRNIITGAAMAFRRSLLSDVLPLPAQGWVHDAWIGVIAAMRGEIDTLEELLISYRLHAGNQLGVGKEQSKLPRKEHRLHM